uniref:Protein SSUH2 homolog n=1 Tax=Ditylenchus dipsaci TaxID=166011 RepID=A0A915EV31_9BILA
MIDEEAVRQAVLTKAKKFWSKKQVDKMVLTNFEPDDCNHYMMESFREARKTKEKSEPFGSSAEQRHQENMNSLSTLPPGQVPPTLWSIIVEPDQDFIQQKKVSEMPGSSRVRECGKCRGCGKVRCDRCNATGFEKCSPCGGKGWRDLAGRKGDQCISCRGTGKKDCSSCRRTGKKTCGTCSGKGSMRDFTLLKVFFDTKRSDYYTDHDGVPAQKLEQVNGTVRFSDCRAIIVPFEDHPCTEINEASQIFWREHNAPDESLPLPFRLLKHRHFIEIIPIVKGKIKLGEKIYDFSVIGNEHVCDIVKKPSRCSLL